MAVYFVQHQETGLIKIGHSIKPTSRIKKLNSAFGKVTLLGLLPGNEETEKKLHANFKYIRTRLKSKSKYGTNGDFEWFHPHINLLQFIKKKNRADCAN